MQSKRHLLVGEEGGRAILGILLKLEGLLGPAHCLHMHPPVTSCDMYFSAKALHNAGFALLLQYSVSSPTPYGLP